MKKNKNLYLLFPAIYLWISLGIHLVFAFEYFYEIRNSCSLGNYTMAECSQGSDISLIGLYLIHFPFWYNITFFTIIYSTMIHLLFFAFLWFIIDLFIKYFFPKFLEYGKKYRG